MIAVGPFIGFRRIHGGFTKAQLVYGGAQTAAACQRVVGVVARALLVIAVADAADDAHMFDRIDRNLGVRRDAVDMLVEIAQRRRALGDIGPEERATGVPRLS